MYWSRVARCFESNEALHVVKIILSYLAFVRRFQSISPNIELPDNSHNSSQCHGPSLLNRLTSSLLVCPLVLLLLSTNATSRLFKLTTCHSSAEVHKGFPFSACNVASFSSAVGIKLPLSALIGDVDGIILCSCCCCSKCSAVFA